MLNVIYCMWCFIDDWWLELLNCSACNVILPAVTDRKDPSDYKIEKLQDR